MDDLNELAFFAKVVEAGSFTGAARTLRVPKATVSRKVASLETRLGARLLHRTTRRIRLTELGEAYYRRCAEIMLSVEDAQTLVGGFLAAPRGRLRLSAPVAFGSTILADWVAEFLVAMPEVEAEVLLSNQYVDLLAEGIDVAFRAGPLQESSLVARRLGPVPYVMCAAPDYLREHGTPRKPSDLREHACIGLLGLPQRDRWPLAGPRGEQQAEVASRMVSNDILFARRAALQGAGIAYVPAFLVADDFRSARLVRLMPAYGLPARELYAVYPSRNYLAPAVRAFLDFVVAKVTPQAPWVEEP
jgi:DNA-binding transcriptional LysR family regulator